MLLNTGRINPNLNSSFIGQEYNLVADDTISDMMKQVYGLPSTGTTERAGYYRAFYELQIRYRYIPSSHQENTIYIGEKVKFFPLSEIEAQRNTPGLRDRIITYVAPAEPIVTPPPVQEMSMFNGKNILIAMAVVGTIAYFIFGKKKK